LPQEAHKVQQHRMAPRAARFGQRHEMLGPVVGMGILRAAIRMVRQGAEEIEVDAVHGFRPKLDCRFGIAEFPCYSESANSLGRKLS
jgi:hypothetical protein